MRKLPALLLVSSVAGVCAQEAPPSFDIQRREMVRAQIEARGVKDPRVLGVMQRVPRHEFVPPALAPRAYVDGPLSIGYGQTISQPYIVAYMTELLQPEASDVVLEIGTGSGYQAAVLAELSKEVLSIELIPELAERAYATLKRLGYRNVQVRAGDGYAGWPERAPFRRIMVTAAPPEIPQALVEQLAEGGTMVVPVGDYLQQLMVVRKTAKGIVRETTIPVRFVPMIKRSRP
ncbi:MAG TPA: protein-L-isoaspartate(D-aspartate) O-methyltransferase [Vicinamibacterales bacterium]|nr:protein-L-isoaspartate(D-aspartate) O-methyltransferase [Vicinamibacterales bacterium]